MTTDRSLADLLPPQGGRIERIEASGPTRQRLLDLGLVPGTAVQATLQASGGQPTAYRFRGVVMALRHADAARVRLMPEAIAPLSAEPAPLPAGLLPEHDTDDPAGEPGPIVALTPRRQSAPADARREFLVGLAGNPNTGKSTVFNGLTGLRQHTGNWPGKTVARTEGRFTHRGAAVRVVDLPGTYSLRPWSVDEEVARDFLLYGVPDVIVVVVDATALERNLSLVLQTVETTDRVVVCLNLVDEARRARIELDPDRLSAALGVPVVATAAIRGQGLDQLADRIVQVADGTLVPRPRRVSYPPPVEAAARRLTARLREAWPQLANPRWVALRLLEGDQTITEALATGRLPRWATDCRAMAAPAPAPHLGDDVAAKETAEATEATAR